MCLVRQPPPSATARHASAPDGKLCWQNTFQPAATVPFAPKSEHGWPAAGKPGDGSAVVGALVGLVVVAVEVAVEIVLVELGAMLLVLTAAMLLDVGGAMVSVVTAIVNGGVVGRVEITAVVRRTVAFGAEVVGTARVRATRLGVPTLDAVVKGVVLGAADDNAADSAGDDSAAVGNPADEAVVEPAISRDWSRALLPITRTTPTSTPTVMLSAAAVRSTPSARGTAPPSAE